METKLRKLTPPDGYLLCDKNQTLFSDELYLSIKDSEQNYTIIKYEDYVELMNSIGEEINENFKLK